MAWLLGAGGGAAAGGAGSAGLAAGLQSGATAGAAGAGAGAAGAGAGLTGAQMAGAVLGQQAAANATPTYAPALPSPSYQSNPTASLANRQPWDPPPPPMAHSPFLGQMGGPTRPAGHPSTDAAVSATQQAAEATQGWRGLVGKMIEGQTGTNPFTMDYDPQLQNLSPSERLYKAAGRYLEQGKGQGPFQPMPALPNPVYSQPRTLERSYYGYGR